jgi:hypothetical protein
VQVQERPNLELESTLPFRWPGRPGSRPDMPDNVRGFSTRRFLSRGENPLCSSRELVPDSDRILSIIRTLSRLSFLSPGILASEKSLSPLISSAPSRSHRGNNTRSLTQTDADTLLRDPSPFFMRGRCGWK